MEHISSILKRIISKAALAFLESKIDYKKFDPELSLKIDEIIEARNE